MIVDDRYLDVVSADDIRIKGTRVGIEHLLAAYLAGRLPEEICLEFPTVTLEQVHGVIAWYLRNRQEVDGHLARLRADAQRARRDQAVQPEAEVVTRLRHLIESRVGE